jgi:hypothetical protein
MLKKVALAVGLIVIRSIAPAQQQQCQLECTLVTWKGRKLRSLKVATTSMLVIVQIWDAQNQEVTRRVGATSRRIACKIAEVFHDRSRTLRGGQSQATPKNLRALSASMLRSLCLLDGQPFGIICDCVCPAWATMHRE